MAEGLVVVGKLGVIGSEPLGFYNLLAAHLEADIHSPTHIQKQLFPVQSGARRSRAVRDRVEDEVYNRTARSLELGRSALFDGYVNKPEKRQALVALAQEFNATVVLIHLKAGLVTVRQRIVEQHTQGTLPVFSEQLGFDSEFKLAHSMMSYLRRSDINPDANKVPHLCIDADGPVTAKELMPRVDDYIASLQRTPDLPQQRS